MHVAKKRRGKRVTPELHKVFWRAYIFTDPNTLENHSAKVVWDVLMADPIMFDPKRILIEDSINKYKLFYYPKPGLKRKVYKRSSFDSMLSRLKNNPPQI